MSADIGKLILSVSLFSVLGERGDVGLPIDFQQVGPVINARLKVCR